MKLSDKMIEELDYAARIGWQGEMVFCNRRTEDALLRRGLITYEYNPRTFAAAIDERGHRNPILTVAGWAAVGDRPADEGRYTLHEALQEARDPSISDGWRRSLNSDVSGWGTRNG